MVGYHNIGYIIQEHKIIFAGLLFAIIYIFLMIFDPPNGDVAVFFDYSQMLKDGTLFEDGVFSEYPPLAWAFILLPGLFTNDLQAYYEIFAGIDVICMFLIAVLILKICENRTKHSMLILMTYIVFTAIYADHAVKKFDIVPVLMMTASIYYFLQNKYLASSSLAIIGGLVKLFPFALILVFILVLIKDRTRVMEYLKSVMICCIAVAAVVAVLIMAGVSPEIFYGFITFQNDRGFHVESMVGTVTTIICEILGMPTGYVPKYHTHDVVNELCDALIGYWSIIMLAILLTVFILVCYRRFKVNFQTEEEEFKLIVALLLIFMVAVLLSNKVFSTQFIQWIYPAILLFMCYHSKFDTRMICLSWIVVVLLSRVFLDNRIQPLLLFRDIIMIYLAFVAYRYISSGRWELSSERHESIKELAQEQRFH